MRYCNLPRTPTSQPPPPHSFFLFRVTSELYNFRFKLENLNLKCAVSSVRNFFFLFYCLHYPNFQFKNPFLGPPLPYNLSELWADRQPFHPSPGIQCHCRTFFPAFHLQKHTKFECIPGRAREGVISISSNIAMDKCLKISVLKRKRKVERRKEMVFT